ncbi:MAG: hypothetical protein IH948_06805, partial [Bacteroidetes bacterium]|nr:hypothetical protein [Bacteroidota bacterium]
MKIIPVAVVIITAIVTIVFSVQITTVSIDNLSISWTLSYLMPRILILAVSIVLIAQIRQLLKKTKSVLRIPAMIVVALLFPAIHFAVHPIYEGDLNKRGEEIPEKRFIDNEIVNWINKSDADFQGLICIASPTCPHCVIAVSKLSRLLN